MENKEFLDLILRIAESYYSLEYDIYGYEDNIVGITITSLVRDDFSNSFLFLKALELIEESKKFNGQPYEEIERRNIEELYDDVDNLYSDEVDVFEEEELNEINALEEPLDESGEDSEDYEESYSLEECESYDTYEDIELEEDEYEEDDEYEDEDEVTFFLRFKTVEEMQKFVIKSFF